MLSKTNYFRETGIEYAENESLTLHSTFRIGGRADLALFPKTAEELRKAIRYLRESGRKFIVVGKGSNILFSDEGYRGAVVFTGGISEIRIEGTHLIAGCGASLRGIAQTAAEKGLSGLEWAHGIPGSVGGGVYMNACAFGGEIANVLEYSVCLHPDTNEIRKYLAREHAFGVKHSRYMESGEIILETCFALTHGDPDGIRAKMTEFHARRRTSQPLNFPSAGSVFKRPAESFAGKLIEEAGLKGYRIGGAVVSEKHAGFIVNLGGATAKDVKMLMEQIRETVYHRSGVVLEPEIRLIEE